MIETEPEGARRTAKYRNSSSQSLRPVGISPAVRPVPLLPADEVEVPEIDQEAHPLADDEDRVLPDDRVGQEQGAPPDAEIPERHGDDALLVLLGVKPLDEEPHEEKRLAREPQDEDPRLSPKHCSPGSAG